MLGCLLALFIGLPIAVFLWYSLGFLLSSVIGPLGFVVSFFLVVYYGGRY